MRNSAMKVRRSFMEGGVGEKLRLGAGGAMGFFTVFCGSWSGHRCS
jgi:hypothetical protein